MSNDLQHNIQFLNAILTDVLERFGPSEHLHRIEKLLHCTRDGEANDFQEAKKHITDLSLDEIRELIKTITLRFHLRNQAEKVEIVNVNRKRLQAATRFQPRRESIAEAITTLKARGYSFDTLQRILKRIEIQPTLTAHPTESRRRTLLRRQRDIAESLVLLHESESNLNKRKQIEDEIRQLVLLLYITDEVRVERLGVLEEIEGSLYFLTNSIWQAIPRIATDLNAAIKQCYHMESDYPTLLRYRTWIGGDRVGNPLVNAEMTKQSLHLHRRAAIQQYQEHVSALMRLLSVSDRRLDVPGALRDSIQPERIRDIVPEKSIVRLRHEPFRLKLLHIRGLLDAALESDGAYDAPQLIADLELLAGSLQEMNLGELVRSSGLANLLIQAKVFGFHLAALDVRQHSAVHERVVQEMLNKKGLCDKYSSLPETEKIELLSRSIERMETEPFFLDGFSKESQELLDVIGTIGSACRQDRAAIGGYIISMASAVSDVLEVLFLMRAGGSQCVDIVPLFETIEDLSNAPRLLKAMFANPVYRAHVKHRGDFQEIMLGYSDSNKDGGYLMSGCLLYTAQSQISRVCRAGGIDFRFFHGRGGTVGRGGGRANRAIHATPPDSRDGGIRMTEQGEVISFRYALPDIAHRHLEQLTSAMILAEAEATTAPSARDDADEELFRRMGERAMQAYRSLIEDEGFWPWFREVSPIAHIGGLPIASRPVLRNKGTMQFENLRAIPWVFAWTQIRLNVPGWFGLGTALGEAVEETADALQRLRRWYEQWEYFRTLIDNAQQEMARARPVIARSYDKLAEVSFCERIISEYDTARTAILSITGQNELLDNNPVIQRSIEERNHPTDLLHLLQMELLRRYKVADETTQQKLRPALFASINAIAAAMQSTG